jgi:hypothetical protein
MAILAEVRWQVDVLLLWLQPTALSEARRAAALAHVQAALLSEPGLKDARAFLTGSYAAKTYLPDADVDLTLIFPQPPIPDDWVHHVNAALCKAALRASPVEALQVRNVTFINGRVKVFRAF